MTGECGGRFAERGLLGACALDELAELLGEEAEALGAGPADLGDEPSDVRLTDQEAAKLGGTNRWFLAEGRVAIVTDGQ